MTTPSDVLENDLSWREAEIASLKLLIADAKPGSVRERSLLRALWTMLYAHYEGFFKFAWDFYLDTLQSFGLSRAEAVDAVARFSLAKEFRVLRGNLSSEALWSCFIADFDQWMRDRLTFDIKLETNSNLWPSVALKNSQQVGLPSAQVENNDLKLRSLVARRNEIAHGKQLVIKSLSEYQPYEDAVVLAMHELAVGVIEALEDRKYLKVGTGQPVS